MKTYSKSIFLTMVILFLLVFLSGCLPGLTPASPKGVISGRVMVPSSEAVKDISGWVPAANATVTLTDANGVTHTVTTDENGYYTFVDITANANAVITAIATIDGNTVVMKDVVPQAVAAIEDYDAGTMTPESTALGLIVEELIEQGLTSEDINLQEIQASDNFSTVVEQVSSVLEEHGNVTTNPGVIEVVNNAAEEIINPPAPTPTPTPVAATPVAFSTLTANGESAVTTTTELTLTFNADPTTLTADNITVTGATKGDLTDNGDLSYTLTISAIAVLNGANVKVEIADPAGFAITPASKDVSVNVAATPVTFLTLTANGESAVTTTTELILTFDVDPTTLTADNITVTGATKGDLTDNGDLTYTLTISAIAVLNGANVKVEIADPAGFAITPASKDVSVNVAPAVINIKAITGVTAPVTGGTPVATITPTDQYTGTVAWSPVHATFAGTTAYTATIILTAKSGYTLTGVGADFFTVDGTTAANAADSGKVTSVAFSATLAVAIGNDCGGGIVAYILQSDDLYYDADKQHGLIAATADINSGEVVTFEWGCYETYVGAGAEHIGTGQNNTNLIVNWLDNINTDNTYGDVTNRTNRAAYLCDTYSITVDSITYDDWFLPSKDELHKLYINRDVISGFADNKYWSSSEDNTLSAWYRSFGSDSQGSTSKVSSFRVRAVREF